jgi:hypothetical protein
MQNSYYQKKELNMENDGMKFYKIIIGKQAYLKENKPNNNI